MIIPSNVVLLNQLQLYFMPNSSKRGPLNEEGPVPKKQKHNNAVLTTEAGGNSLFHAVFGSPNSNGHYQATKAATMRQEWYNFLKQFSSLEDTNMSNALKDQLEKIFQCFLNDPKLLPNESQEIRSVVETTKKKINKAKEDALKLKISIFDKLSGDAELLAQIHTIVVQDNKVEPKRGELQKKSIGQDELLDINTFLDEVQPNLQKCALASHLLLDAQGYDTKYNAEFIREKFLQGKEVYECYLKAIQNNKYHILFEEVPVIASLSNREIIIYSDVHEDHYQEHIIPSPALLNANYTVNKELWGHDTKPAIVCHKGVLFLYAEGEVSKQEDSIAELSGPKDMESYDQGGIYDTDQINQKDISKFALQTRIQNLLDVKMSNKVLVDILLKDKDENEVIILGRSEVYGHQKQQLRHVTHFAAITHNIKEFVKSDKEKVSKVLYVKQLVKIMQPLINVQKKYGLCFAYEEYEQYKGHIPADYVTKIIYKDKQQFFVVQNKNVIDKFKKEVKLTTNEEQKFKAAFQKQFLVYVKDGIESLSKELVDDNSITIVCEILARLILTMFNQGKYVTFPEEGNSLLEEIRLYRTKELAKDSKVLKKSIISQMKDGDFIILNHPEICKKLRGVLEDVDARYASEVNEKWSRYFGEKIRIVDNEGATITRCMKMLDILNKIIENQLMKYSKYVTKYTTDYNNENICLPLTKVFHGEIDQTIKKRLALYIDDINHNNLVKNIFHHAAKLLYIIYDFKPLESEILIERQKGDHNVVKVYPSAVTMQSSKYAIQDGVKHRESKVELAKAKLNSSNVSVLFREDTCDHTTEEEKRKLQDIIYETSTRHIKLLLMSFNGLKACISDDNNDGVAKISKYFLELIHADYDSVMGIDFDNAWQNKVIDCIKTIYDTDLLGA